MSNSILDTRFAAMAMADSGATIAYLFMRDDGSVAHAAYAVRPHQTIVIDAADVVGPRAQSYATMVESDRPLAAGRLVSGANPARTRNAASIAIDGLVPRRGRDRRTSTSST